VRDNPKPLNCLAIVRMSDIAPHSPPPGLPARGALLFIYDVERCQGSFWPEARGGWRVLHVPDEAELIVVVDPPVQVAEVVPCALRAPCAPRRPRGRRGPPACQLASNGVDCGSPEDVETPRAQALAAGSRDGRLLLQIDSDEAGPGWMWGDMGRLNFCLHRDDLAAGRCDRTWCVEQSHRADRTRPSPRPTDVSGSDPRCQSGLLSMQSR
jgi:hypothetical protein